MKNIISFSRRTDGITFYMKRLEKAIEEEFIMVRNPYNQKLSSISLKPEDVAGFVLWSKNFENFLKNSNIFEKYRNNIYFQFTRNTTIRILEPNSPSLEESVSQMERLVKLMSPAHIMWRFDPIVFWKEDNLLYNNLGDFNEIASHFSKLGVKRCTISFATYYSKVTKRMRKNLFNYYEPTIKERIIITQELIKKAKKYEIKLFACCNPDLLVIPEISQAHCVDGNYLNKLWKIKHSLAKDTGQRESCGCTKSRDIGGYGEKWKCHHGCLYCYANPNLNIS